MSPSLVPRPGSFLKSISSPRTYFLGFSLPRPQQPRRSRVNPERHVCAQQQSHNLKLSITERRGHLSPQAGRRPSFPKPCPPGNRTPDLGHLRDFCHPSKVKLGVPKRPWCPCLVRRVLRGRGSWGLPRACEQQVLRGGEGLVCVPGLCLIWHRLIPAFCWALRAKQMNRFLRTHDWSSGHFDPKQSDSDKARGIIAYGLCHISHPPERPVASPLPACLPPMQPAADTVGTGRVLQVCGNCWPHGVPGPHPHVGRADLCVPARDPGWPRGAWHRAVSGRSRGAASFPVAPGCYFFGFPRKVPEDTFAPQPLSVSLFGT
ncbi:uncharacterized protein LOC111731418 [Pteropus vampyrus]|uniref:Uncharacterized protein LOC111731418 n=1 Tax=Pteropus vampyrus TaxID=132908 RepID=A0A6P6BUQ2_PTEVA|nr:uncharacterized protein LOC111731418 [Pteropus vampyrus]